MSANKYVRVSRTFRREMAIEIGIEKCYALIQFAKVVGRAKDAVAIWQSDERIHGAPRDRPERDGQADHRGGQDAQGGHEEAGDAARGQRRARGGGFQDRLDLRVAPASGPRGPRRRAASAARISANAVRTLDVRISKGLKGVVKDFSKRQPALLEPLKAIGWAPKVAS